MIELKNITKTFSEGNISVHAVKDVSLVIDKGEIFGIIGFSGAGKSTLVRCINLLERPDTGKVFVDGKDLTALKAKELRSARKKIGMIFQHFNLKVRKKKKGKGAFVFGRYSRQGECIPESVIRRSKTKSGYSKSLGK